MELQHVTLKIAHQSTRNLYVRNTMQLRVSFYSVYVSRAS